MTDISSAPEVNLTSPPAAAAVLIEPATALNPIDPDEPVAEMIRDCSSLMADLDASASGESNDVDPVALVREVLTSLAPSTSWDADARVKLAKALLVWQVCALYIHNHHPDPEPQSKASDAVVSSVFRHLHQSIVQCIAANFAAQDSTLKQIGAAGLEPAVTLARLLIRLTTAEKPVNDVAPLSSALFHFFASIQHTINEWNDAFSPYGPTRMQIVCNCFATLLQVGCIPNTDEAFPVLFHFIRHQNSPLKVFSASILCRCGVLNPEVFSPFAHQLLDAICDGASELHVILKHGREIFADDPSVLSRRLPQLMNILPINVLLPHIDLALSSHPDDVALSADRIVDDVLSSPTTAHIEIITRLAKLKPACLAPHLLKLKYIFIPTHNVLQYVHLLAQLGYAEPTAVRAVLSDLIDLLRTAAGLSPEEQASVLGALDLLKGFCPHSNVFTTETMTILHTAAEHNWPAYSNLMRWNRGWWAEDRDMASFLREGSSVRRMSPFTSVIMRRVLRRGVVPFSSRELRPLEESGVRRLPERPALHDPPSDGMIQKLGRSYTRDSVTEVVALAVAGEAIAEAVVEAVRRQPSIENSAPLSITIENSAPLSTTIENSAPLSTTIENSAPLSTTIENSAPLSTTIENSAPLSTTIENSAPLSTTIENSAPLSTTIENSAPVSTTIENSAPLSTTIENSAPPNTTHQLPETVADILLPIDSSHPTIAPAASPSIHNIIELPVLKHEETNSPVYTPSSAVDTIEPVAQASSAELVRSQVVSIASLMKPIVSSAEAEETNPLVDITSSAVDTIEPAAQASSAELVRSQVVSIASLMKPIVSSAEAVCKVDEEIRQPLRPTPPAVTMDSEQRLNPRKIKVDLFAPIT